MSMFPHTVTLYNVEVRSDPDTVKDTFINHITILRGVLLDASRAVNVRESGLTGADTAVMYIPFDVVAVDAAYAEMDNPPTKKYVPPAVFWAAEDKSELWTMSAGIFKAGDISGSCRFVKGVAVHPDDPIEEIEVRHGGAAYDIAAVDTKDFGGLQHWEVRAK